MDKKPDGLDERQILAAQALANGCSWRDAARRAKCTSETIRMWRKEDAFNNAVWSYQQEIYQQAFGIVSEALPMAISTLREIVASQDPDVGVNVKVQAIKLLIDASQRQYETRTIERRIEQLEGYARSNVTVETIEARTIAPGEGAGGGEA
tara:strand:+ start:154 stop:606 length:453 start_codon:yes stop_codon:yes gene_type:complete